MSFTTKGVDENASEGKYIKPGVHEVTITAVTSKESGEGTNAPSIFVNFAKKGTEQELNVQFAFSEKGTKFALMKLKHLLTKVTTENTVDAISANTVTELAKAYGKILTGKELRIKFNGKEVAGVNGKNNWFKAELGIPRKGQPFAEALTTSPTTLTFTESIDVKRLGATTATPTKAGVTVGDDLPF